MSDGNDPLEELGRALRARAPRPDPAVRAAHLARAREAFGRPHEAGGPRSGAGRPAPGWRAGLGWVVGGRAGRSALAAGALAACGVLLVPMGRESLERLPEARERAVAPAEAQVGAPAQEAAGPSAKDQGDGSGNAAETESLAQARQAAPMAEAAPGGPRPLEVQEVMPPEPLPEPIAPVWIVPQGEGDGEPDPADRSPTLDPEAFAAPAPLAREAAPAVPPPAAAVRPAIPADEGDVATLLAAYPPRWPAAPDGGPRVTASAIPAPWDAEARLVVVGVGGSASAGGLEVAWDPEAVASWRRLGGAPGRGLSDRVSAGDLAGGTALYEVVAWPGGGPLGVARMLDAEGVAAVAIPVVEDGGLEARWAAALGAWALLRAGEDLGGWGLSDLLALAQGALAADPRRTEALALMRAQ